MFGVNPPTLGRDVLQKHFLPSPIHRPETRKKPSIAHGVQSIVASSKMLKIQPRVESYRLPRS